MIGGKDKYVNLLILVKKEQPRLYELICNLSLDNLFRSTKKPFTFLMPSTALVDKIDAMVEDDNDVDAIKILRSLLLEGHFEKSYLKKGAKIGTVQYGSHVLTKPEEVAKQISESKKAIISTRKNVPVTIVYEYKGSDAPSTVEGIADKPTAVSGGSSIGHHIKIVYDFTVGLIVEGDGAQTCNNFLRAVSAVLGYLSQKDPSRFQRVKFYFAANPILSWYFLTAPGSPNPLVTANDLKDIDVNATVLAGNNAIAEAEEAGGYTLNKDVLQLIRERRKPWNDGRVDRTNVVDFIRKAYEDLLPKLLKGGAIDENLKQNMWLKIRMDELRHMHEAMDHNNWQSVNDTIVDVARPTNIATPKTTSVYCDPKLYSEHLLRSKEAFESGPCAFIVSVYFVYVPLTAKHEKQLAERCGGVITGGNPIAPTTVTFLGGSARQVLAEQTQGGSLEKLVSQLTQKQREEL